MKMLCVLGGAFGLIILAIAVIGVIILFSIKIIKGGFSHKDRQHLTKETQMVQDIYQGLRKMEKRVESLETLLMDQDRKGDKQWDDFNK